MSDNNKTKKIIQEEVIKTINTKLQKYMDAQEVFIVPGFIDRPTISDFTFIPNKSGPSNSIVKDFVPVYYIGFPGKTHVTEGLLEEVGTIQINVLVYSNGKTLDDKDLLRYSYAGLNNFKRYIAQEVGTLEDGDETFKIMFSASTIQQEGGKFNLNRRNVIPLSLTITYSITEANISNRYQYKIRRVGERTVFKLGSDVEGGTPYTDANGKTVKADDFVDEDNNLIDGDNDSPRVVIDDKFTNIERIGGRASIGSQPLVNVGNGDVRTDVQVTPGNKAYTASFGMFDNNNSLIQDFNKKRTSRLYDPLLDITTNVTVNNDVYELLLIDKDLEDTNSLKYTLKYMVLESINVSETLGSSRRFDVVLREADNTYVSNLLKSN